MNFRRLTVDALGAPMKIGRLFESSYGLPRAGRGTAFPVLPSWRPDPDKVIPVTSRARPATPTRQLRLVFGEGRSVVTAQARVDEPIDQSFTALNAVVCGSFRKDVGRLRDEFDTLRSIGCRVLSPLTVDIESEHDGFVYMKGESNDTPERIEARHLSAIEQADFVWLHVPEGYVGLSASMEVGFAHACGVPIFSAHPPSDRVLARMVSVVSSPAVAIADVRRSPTRAPMGLRAFQSYYRRAAIRRGYNDTDAKACLLLMVEEVGELAREIRKKDGLTRHSREGEKIDLRELADVFLYVVHMANLLNLDLAELVGAKEIVNHARALRSPVRSST